MFKILRRHAVNHKEGFSNPTRMVEAPPTSAYV